MILFVWLPSEVGRPECPLMAICARRRKPPPSFAAFISLQVLLFSFFNFTIRSDAASGKNRKSPFNEE